MVAVNDQGLDFAWSKPPASVTHAAGFKYVSRYLSWLPNGKCIDHAEAQSTLANGVDIFLNWEFASTDQLGGANYGVIQAKEACRQAKALGYPAGATLFYSGDFDEAPSQAATVAAYVSAARAVTHDFGYRIGEYGGYYIVKRLFDAGLIDDGWQAYAWSGGQWDKRASLRQVQNGYPFHGYDVDRNICVGPAYSWLRPYKAVAPAPVPKPAPKPAPVPTVEDDEVKNIVFAQDGVGGPVYVGDFIQRRWLQNPTELEEAQYWVGKRGGDATVNVFDPGTLHVLGVLVGPVATTPAGPAPVK